MAQFSSDPVENRWWHLAAVFSVLNCDERIVHAMAYGTKGAIFAEMSSPRWPSCCQRSLRPKLCVFHGGTLHMRKRDFVIAITHPAEDGTGHFVFDLIVSHRTSTLNFAIDHNGTFSLWKLLTRLRRLDFRFWRKFVKTVGGTPKKDLYGGRRKFYYLKTKHWTLEYTLQFDVIYISLTERGHFLDEWTFTIDVFDPKAPFHLGPLMLELCNFQKDADVWEWRAFHVARFLDKTREGDRWFRQKSTPFNRFMAEAERENERDE